MKFFGEIRQAFTERIQQQLAGMKIEMTVSTNPKIIGGFVLESNYKRLDASTPPDRRDIKN